jgi:hypothetical protein
LDEQEDPYRSWRDIVKYHGLVVALLYSLTRLTAIAPNRLWSWFGRLPFVKPIAAYEGGPKMKPWWQDAFVIITIGTTVFLAMSAATCSPSLWSEVLAWVLLLDMLSYHVRVLWFDDLAPRRPWRYARVFSHRRILFQAFIQFAESIFLFGILYLRHGCSAGPYSAICDASFSAATTLSAPEVLKSCASLSNVQVVFSLFFLVIVISIVASVGYTRKQLAPEDNEP